jgi:hypothetical protein
MRAASLSTAFPGVAGGSIATLGGGFIRTIVVFIAFGHERHSFSSVGRTGGKRQGAMKAATGRPPAERALLAPFAAVA